MSRLGQLITAGVGAGLLGNALSLSTYGVIGLGLIFGSLINAIHAATQRKEAA